MKKIWADGLSTVRNCTLAFVTEIEKCSLPTLLKIAASNTFRVFVNGSFVFYGPQRTAHGYSLVHEIEMDQYLTEKVNRLIIEVASYNTNSFYTVDEAPFFAAEINTPYHKIADTEDFHAYCLNDRIKKVQRYNFQRSFIEAYNYYDRGNLYQGDINYPSVCTVKVPGNELMNSELPLCAFPLESFKAVLESGTVHHSDEKCSLSDRIYLYTSDTVKGYDYNHLSLKLSDEILKMRFDADNTIRQGKITENRYVLIDFGRNMTGLFGFDIEVYEKSTLYFIFDEIIWDEVKELEQYRDYNMPYHAKPLVFCRTNTCNAIKWDLDKGKYSLLSFEPYTCRFGKLIVTRGSAVINDCYIRLYENEEAYRLKFETEDEEQKKIFDSAVNTFAQNAVDVLIDCPSRERGGWLCDSYFTAKAERLLTGANKIEKNLLVSYILAEQSADLPSGMIPMCYPADHTDKTFIPNWAMWFAVELEDYYKRSGDILLVRAGKELLYGLVNYFAAFENELGLLEKLDGWVFVEWSRANDFIEDVNLPTNMLYYAMLKSIGYLFKDNSLLEKAEVLKATIRNISWDGTYFADHLVRVNGTLERADDFSETCQYYAFFFGIAEKAGHAKLHHILFQNTADTGTAGHGLLHPSDAFIGYYLRLLYLMNDGQNQKVYQEIKHYFLSMAERTRTLWESSKFACSCCHGFASLAANFVVFSAVGFCGVDSSRKLIILNREFGEAASSAEIPFEDGIIHIKCKEGKREVLLPEQTRYKIIMKEAPL